MDLFPAVWRWMASLVAAGHLRATAVVLEELSRKDDELLSWARGQKDFVVPLDGPVQLAASDILARFPDWVDANATETSADPFVVALAQVHGLTVVTQERPNSGRPHIPDVCRAYQITCCDLLGLMRQESLVLGGWPPRSG